MAFVLSCVVVLTTVTLLSEDCTQGNF